MNRLLATFAFALLLPFLLGAAAATAPASSSGDFNAKLEVKALKNEKSGRMPQLTFSGHFEHSGSNFRLEVNNDLTAEQQIYVVNGGTKKAWMLFPDTLNGISGDLGAVDKENLFQQAQQFMQGQYSKVPDSWGKPQKKSETLNGRAVTHLTFIKAKSQGKGSGNRMDVWHTAANEPVKLVLDSSAMKMTISFEGYQKNPALAGTRFQPDKSYKIRPLGKGEQFPMPGGIPQLRGRS
jgi:hypothetical protein